MTNIACIVLAAGASRRMGFPKASLDVGGLCAFERIADTWRKVVPDRTSHPLHVVVGIPPTGIPPSETSGHLISINPEPERGRTGSIQVGLQGLPPDCSATLIWPVDVPMVSAQSIASVLGALSRHSEDGRVVPRHDQRGGHPIGIGRRWWPSIYAMLPDTPLFQLFEQDGPRVEHVTVDDPAIRWNLNTPEDVLRYLHRHAKPLLR